MPNINVFFDNLQVTHIHGPLLQEQSYYPFGLEMGGISDKALGKLDSKNKFNGGAEIEEDYGVNLYSTFYRQYDPQIGRFSGVDALGEESIGFNPYQFGNDNPVSYNDPLGLQSRYGGMPDRYIDANGNIWHTPGVLHGIPGLESVPFSYEDEFNFLLQNDFGGDGGGWGGVVKPGSKGGQQGFWVSWDMQGDAAHGKTLAEAKIAREFVAYSYYGNEEGNGWETAHHVVHWTEFTFTAGEVSNASKTFGEFGGAAYWVGKNLKVYSQAWGGNGFTGGRNAVQEFAEGMGKVAKPLGIITSIASVGQAVYDVSQGHYEAAGVHGLDAVMGAVGTFGGPVGWAVSGAYFISRFWWGNDDD